MEIDVSRPDCLSLGRVAGCGNGVPAVEPLSFPLHTQEVLRRIQAAREDFGRLSPDLGWQVLRAMWGVTPSSLDSGALRYLRLQPPALQQHVLLTLATTKVRSVKNLSAFLSQLLHDADASPPLCLGLLAGCCPTGAHCGFLHPPERAGWRRVWDRWHVTWRDFDYLVLNALYQRPVAQQEAALGHLSDMKLRTIRNLSALLASVLRRFDALPDAADTSTLSCGPATAAAAATIVSTGEFQQRCTATLAELSSQTSDTDTIGHGIASANSLDNLSLSSCPTPDEPELDASLCTADPSGSLLPVIHMGSLDHRDSSPRHRTQRTADALRLLQSITAPPPGSGWEVLQALWGIGPMHFDPAALKELRTRSPSLQEHILTTLAASDLPCFPNLTALLRSFMAPQAQPPTCWRFLAGVCPDEDACAFLHPVLVPAWALLFRTWRMTFMHFDFAALDVLFHLPPPNQDRILSTLAQQPLPQVPSPSALLMHIIQHPQLG